MDQTDLSTEESRGVGTIPEIKFHTWEMQHRLLLLSVLYLAPIPWLLAGSQHREQQGMAMLIVLI